jgi:hypothetical protein
MQIQGHFSPQMPQGKEISLRTHWDLPSTLKEIWSTRVHLQLKTPFPNYTSLDFQTVIGQQEDSETLGLIGIYSDHFQYSITVNGEDSRIKIKLG